MRVLARQLGSQSPCVLLAQVPAACPSLHQLLAHATCEAHYALSHAMCKALHAVFVLHAQSTGSQNHAPG